MGRLSRTHGSPNASGEKIMKKSRLRPISKKRAGENVLYRKAKEEWREKRIKIDGYHQCEFVGKPYAYETFSWPSDQNGRCILLAMKPPHHKKGHAGSLHYDKRYFLSLCAFHHSWVHDHANEARKRKYLLF